MQHLNRKMLRINVALAILALILTPASAALAESWYVPTQPVAVQTAPPRFVGSPSFFPPRPAHAEIRYRTGVLTDWENGNKSGWVTIRDAAGRTFGYFTGWPMFIDGKQTHCAIAPRPGARFDKIACDGGWPADVVIGVTRVRVYYWHDVTPWDQHVEVTDQIVKAPLRD